MLRCLCQLSGACARLTAELGVVGILVAEVRLHDEVTLGKVRLVRALLSSLHLLNFDVDLVRNAFVLVRGPVVQVVIGVSRGVL